MLALRQDSGALTMNPRKLLAGKSATQVICQQNVANQQNVGNSLFDTYCFY